MRIKRILLSASLLISSVYAQKHVEYSQPAKGDDVIGQIMYVTPHRHESLADLTIRYEMGYEELKWANPGINAWMLNDKVPLVLPTQFILPAGKRSGIVSNIPEMRTYYFLKDSDKIYVYPVGVGRMDWKTPLGSWAITRKQENPAWYPPESIRQEHLEMGRGVLPKVVPAGPENPLGTRVLRLALPSYLLHGTNEQTGIGMRVTHGCMRFYPQHIEHLYEMVPTNTMVTFLNEPVKYGFFGNDLMMEVHPPLDEDELSVAGLEQMAFEQLETYLKAHPDTSVNNDIVRMAVQQQSGIPIIIGEKNGARNSYNAPSASHNIVPLSTPESEQQESARPAYTPIPEWIDHQAEPKQNQRSNRYQNNQGIIAVEEEIRLTPDPNTIVVPESVPEPEQEPKSDRPAYTPIPEWIDYQAEQNRSSSNHSSNNSRSKVKDEEVVFPEPSSYRFNY
ncbi:L,D-transpeptidase family protein [Ignatzschineria rhizosphaerae]|uniref:L,D-transpeptidase family protein n=1 Tax=Ignatzschineria rhizosphaerae TaxID=2923279 RepID=A0ABY3X970_9GAMM|nr:L,D-transpeptidase family protein [Ignatzschineria rhizosphaerae]UNM97261.1 L,D-transpeptidase family protein [Ignatzschineria rhizosphaerae]